MTETYTYNDWMHKHCQLDIVGCSANKDLILKIAEVLDTNGLKNKYRYFDGKFYMNALDCSLSNVCIAPYSGAIVEITVNYTKYDVHDADKTEVIRINDAEAFYTENYIMCDLPTRLAHATLNVVNKLLHVETCQ